jgi:hypothetical protein
MRNELVGQFTFSKGILENIGQVDGRSYRERNNRNGRRTRILFASEAVSFLEQPLTRESRPVLTGNPILLSLTYHCLFVSRQVNPFLDCYLRSTRTFTESPAFSALRGP